MCLLKMKLSDRELCPCGSEKAYGECCKGIALKIQEPSKKTAEVLIMGKMRKSMRKCCLHPDKANCKRTIKHAHALQNNKIMSVLGGQERHVYLLDSKKKPLLVPMEDGERLPIVEVSKVSVNDATTETCFCEIYDTKAFEIIEAGAPDFDPSNEKMKFDSEILTGTYNGVFTCAIKLDFQIKFADYAYVAPSFDLNGNRIRHTKKGIMHRIAITAFPEGQHSWILISCLESEYSMYEKFFDQLKAASVDKIKFYFNMILPLISENVVLSPELWNRWDDDIKMAYTVYANSNGSDAMRMEMAIGVALKNAYRSKKVSA